MTKYCLPIFIIKIFLILTDCSFADTQILSSEVIGEKRIKLKATDFMIKKSKTEVHYKASLVQGSLEWIRVDKILLMPRARMRVIFNSGDSRIHLKYMDTAISMQRSPKNRLFSEFYVSLFEIKPIQIISGDKKIGEIAYELHSKRKMKKNLVDYSCSKYNVLLIGFEEDFISVGCRAKKYGRIGKEKVLIEMKWIAPGYRLEDSSSPPYSTTFLRDAPVKVNLFSTTGVRKVLEIRASVPKRSHRFKTSLGLGPYGLESLYSGSKKRESIAPAAMIYMNLGLTKDTSIRGFDAIVYDKTVFNNSGFYFAYRLASILDHRVTIIPLLGFQGIFFKHPGQPKNYSKIIYPQGLEIVYKHAFGMKNYSLVYGMFVSPSSKDDDYQNIWIRFGKSVFYELNYINWGDDFRSAKMFGISIGFPFLKFF